MRFAGLADVRPTSRRRGIGAMVAIAPAALALLSLGACGSSDQSVARDAGAPLDDGALATDAGQASADSGATDGGSSGPGGGSDAGSPPGDGGAGSSAGCKRGIAANAAPTSALAPAPGVAGVSWWYDWSAQGASAVAAIEFDPMIWGSASLAGPIPAGSRYLLGFNEPNFKAQSDLTAQQAAADWPKVEALAKTTGARIVSPAVNFCGSASDPSGCSDPTVTDPYTYLHDFLAACAGCEVDAIAVHWYNCDLPSLQAYIDGNVDAGGGLAGFVQFGKPIWLTEFSCDASHSVADQQAYMQAAIPYLESNPHVARYAWFSASPIPNALLANADGSLTDLGKVYVALPQNCP